ncbi:hypothetical protein AMTR_s00101p00133070 [Amborella trichopoda]|uniref:Uncharacterized protein n=1 Tax=Amborella trichopoda TaxID=13333 RepID=W1NQB8_AMBTC|nr:hypothetical protein AMTR_s00101p00133070 [Amborella trichopoda]
MENEVRCNNTQPCDLSSQHCNSLTSLELGGSLSFNETLSARLTVAARGNCHCTNGQAQAHRGLKGNFNFCKTPLRVGINLTNPRNILSISLKASVLNQM